MANLSVGKAWDETSAFLTRESRLVMPVALALLLVPSAIQGWVNPNAQSNGASGTPLVMLVVLLVTLAGQLAIARLAAGWHGSIGSVIGLAFRKLGVVILSAILVYLPLVFLFTIVVGALIGPDDLARIESMPPDQLVQLPGLLWALLLFVAAALLMAARLLPSAAVAMSEKVGPIALIKRSWHLTRGHLWRLSGLVMLLAVASLILSGAAGLVVGSIAVLVAGPAEPLSLSALLIGLATGAVAALVGSVYAAMIGRIYAQLATQAHVPDVSAD